MHGYLRNHRFQNGSIWLPRKNLKNYCCNFEFSVNLILLTKENACFSKFSYGFKFKCIFFWLLFKLGLFAWLSRKS